MKRLLSVLLTVILLVSMFSVAVFAESDTCGDGITWTVQNGVLTISGNGDMSKFERNGDNDTTNAPWWNLRDYIVEIVLEEGIKKIDNYAFYRCTKVGKVTLPQSLERIEARVFKGCSALESVVIPKNVAYLGLEAFADSGLKEITFEGNGPKVSSTPPFSGVTATVTYSGSSFDQEAFGGNLTWVSAAAASFDDLPDPAEGLDMSNPEKEGSCGSKARYAFKNGVLLVSGEGETDRYTRNTDLNTVNNPWYDWRNEIREIVIAKGISRVNNYAFFGCENLEKVTFSATVTAINFGAFKDCTSLKEITLPPGLIELGSQAFATSGLEKITFTAPIPTDVGDMMTDGITATIYYPCSAEAVSATTQKVFSGSITWLRSHNVENGICTICGASESVIAAEQAAAVGEASETSEKDTSHNLRGLSLSTWTIVNLCLTVTALATIVFCIILLAKLKKKAEQE